MTEVVDAARRLEPQVGAIIITGDGEKAFAAGADIKELAQLTYEQVASGSSSDRMCLLSSHRCAVALCFEACWAAHVTSHRHNIASVCHALLLGGCMTPAEPVYRLGRVVII